MKARLMAPIASIHGKIAKGYYARVINGKQVIQRCPIRTKRPTEKQLAARKWFAENLAGRKWRESGSGNRVVCEPTGQVEGVRFKVESLRLKVESLKVRDYGKSNIDVRYLRFY